MSISYKQMICVKKEQLIPSEKLPTYVLVPTEMVKQPTTHQLQPARQQQCIHLITPQAYLR